MDRKPRTHASFVVAELVALIACLSTWSQGYADTAVEAQLRARLETGLVTDSLEVMDDRIHARETLRRVYDATGWPTLDEGPTLRERDEGPRVAQLVEHLRASGDYSGAVTQQFDASVSEAVRRFQTRHGLTPDGLVGRASLAALNTPIQARIDETIVNLERWRWLPESLGDRHVIVNIAGFSLDVVEDEEVTLSMDVVVGRPYRRTPVFSGAISYLVLNPSWEVPSSIAVQDKLPLIKANPAYLREQGYTLHAVAVSGQAGGRCAQVPRASGALAH